LALAYACPNMLGQVNGFDAYTWMHEFTHGLGFVDYLWEQIFDPSVYGQLVNTYGQQTTAVATPKALA